MNIQYIHHNGQPQFAVIPFDDYRELVEKAEMFDDIKSLDHALSIQEETVPAEIVNRILDGENKLKVWREYRGLTQSDLAKNAGLNQPTIAQIETGQRSGTPEIFRKLATALQLDIDDII